MAATAALHERQIGGQWPRNDLTFPINSSGQWRSYQLSGSPTTLLTLEPQPAGQVLVRRSDEMQPEMDGLFTWNGAALIALDPDTYTPLPRPWPRVGIDTPEWAGGE